MNRRLFPLHFEITEEKTLVSGITSNFKYAKYELENVYRTYVLCALDHVERFFEYFNDMFFYRQPQSKTLVFYGTFKIYEFVQYSQVCNNNSIIYSLLNVSYSEFRPMCNILKFEFSNIADWRCFEEHLDIYLGNMSFIWKYNLEEAEHFTIMQQLTETDSYGIGKRYVKKLEIHLVNLTVMQKNAQINQWQDCYFTDQTLSTLEPSRSYEIDMVESLPTFFLHIVYHPEKIFGGQRIRGTQSISMIYLQCCYGGDTYEIIFHLEHVELELTINDKITKLVVCESEKKLIGQFLNFYSGGLILHHLTGDSNFFHWLIFWNKEDTLDLLLHRLQWNQMYDELNQYIFLTNNSFAFHKYALQCCMQNILDSKIRFETSCISIFNHQLENISLQINAVQVFRKNLRDVTRFNIEYYKADPAFEYSVTPEDLLDSKLVQKSRFKTLHTLIRLGCEWNEYMRKIFRHHKIDSITFAMASICNVTPTTYLRLSMQKKNQYFLEQQTLQRNFFLVKPNHSCSLPIQIQTKNVFDLKQKVFRTKLLTSLSGGFCFAKPGFYGESVNLDFSNFYPNILIANNLCFDLIEIFDGSTLHEILNIEDFKFIRQYFSFFILNTGRCYSPFDLKCYNNVLKLVSDDFPNNSTVLCIFKYDKFEELKSVMFADRIFNAFLNRCKLLLPNIFESFVKISADHNNLSRKNIKGIANSTIGSFASDHFCYLNRKLYMCITSIGRHYILTMSRIVTLMYYLLVCEKLKLNKYKFQHGILEVTEIDAIIEAIGMSCLSNVPDGRDPIYVLKLTEKLGIVDHIVIEIDTDGIRIVNKFEVNIGKLIEKLNEFLFNFLRTKNLFFVGKSGFKSTVVLGKKNVRYLTGPLDVSRSSRKLELLRNIADKCHASAVIGSANTLTLHESEKRNTSNQIRNFLLDLDTLLKSSFKYNVFNCETQFYNDTSKLFDLIYYYNCNYKDYICIYNYEDTKTYECSRSKLLFLLTLLSKIDKTLINSK